MREISLPGEKALPVPGDVTALSVEGSISSEVRNEVSAKSSLVDVTERKISRRRCWSLRGVPLRSRICILLVLALRCVAESRLTF